MASVATAMTYGRVGIASMSRACAPAIRLLEDQKIDGFDHSLVVRLGVSPHPCDAGLELLPTQSGQHRIPSGRELLGVRRPVRSNRLREELRGRQLKSSALEHPAQRRAVWEGLFDDRRTRWEERDVRVGGDLLARPGPDEYESSDPEHATTFLRGEPRVGEV